MTIPMIPNSAAYDFLAIFYGTLIIGTFLGMVILMGIWSQKRVNRAKKLHRRRHLKVVR